MGPVYIRERGGGRRIGRNVGRVKKEDKRTEDSGGDREFSPGRIENPDIRSSNSQKEQTDTIRRGSREIASRRNVFKPDGGGENEKGTVWAVPKSLEPIRIGSEWEDEEVCGSFGFHCREPVSYVTMKVSFVKGGVEK